MTELGYNLAVPGASLLDTEGNKLALETKAWTHFNRYLALVDRLPPDLPACSPRTAEALQTLRAQAALFGTPQRLRQLLKERPALLAAEQPPALLYAAMVWEMQRLHESAAAVISFLQSLAGAAGSSGKLPREGLQEIGRLGEQTRMPIAPLISALKGFKDTILSANGTLAAVSKTDAEALHKLQEELGGLQVKMGSMQKELAGMGFFSFGKKDDLEARLKALQTEFSENSARAEQLRLSLSRIEPILDEGYWVEPALNELVTFLEQLRKIGTSFGSGVAQLAADSSELQLQDAAWLGKKLGIDQAVNQWSAIDRAAKQFAVQALVDFT
jgi:hypothetical protein